VKAPLGKHQVSGNWCLFLDKDLNPFKNQYEVLANAQLVNPVKILKQELPDIWKKLTEKSKTRTTTNQATTAVKTSIIRDCVKNAILSGSHHGDRNQTGHIIASELRRAGFDRNQTKSILFDIWNQRNNPLLDITEINTIIASAYGESNYTYSCKENGVLRKHIKCFSYENCFFMSTIKLLNRNKDHASPAS